MTWLNAALAFAITMLILSMVTSVFVETIHRFLKLREKGLYLMAGQFFDRVLGPYLTSRGVKPEDMKKAFLELMTLNRAPAGAAGKTGIDADKTWAVSGDDSRDFDAGLFSRLWTGRRLAKLDANQFMSRLGDSDVGSHVRDAITASGAADPEAALQDIAAKFDAFGREASLFFERRARLTSVLVAIVVAWLMHVQPYDLIKTYLANPATAEAVIAMKEAAEKQYQEQLAAAQAAPDGAEKAQHVAEAEQDLAAVQQQFAGALAEAGQVAKTLQQANVPIGWTKYRLENAGFDLAFDAIPYPVNGKAITAVFWLLIGGLLVGLGGPFWHDIIKSLSSIRTLVGGARSLTNTGAGTASEAATGVSAGAPANPVEHFKASIAGRDAVSQTADRDDDDQPVG